MTFVAVLAGLGAMVLAANGLGWAFRRDLVGRYSGHTIEGLPGVMAGRYFAMAAIALGGLIVGGAATVGFIFFVFGLMGLYDAILYGRLKVRIIPHLVASVGSICIAGAAWIAADGAGV